MPTWDDLTHSEQVVMTEAIRVFLFLRTLQLSIQVARDLERRGLIHIVFTDAKQALRQSWLPELTDAGRDFAAGFIGTLPLVTVNEDDTQQIEPPTEP